MLRPRRTRPPDISALLLYVRAEVRGNDVMITPERPGEPSVRVPNAGRGRGFTPSSPFDHDYHVATDGPGGLRGRNGLNAVGNALVDDPTPGADRPATREGTRNDVGPLAPLLDGRTNYVFSFLVDTPAPDRISMMVVNYTQRGQHLLEEGFVLRYARLSSANSVTLISYGEGNAISQSWLTDWAVGWRAAVRRVWTQNHLDIFQVALRNSGDQNT